MSGGGGEALSRDRPGSAPSLVGSQHIYERAATDVGLFEAVFGGALGPMQSFRDRMTQDEILRLNAYVRKLRGTPRDRHGPHGHAPLADPFGFSYGGLGRSKPMRSGFPPAPHVEEDPRQ